MIETIYSNENGDGNPNKVQVSFRMPKNIRQIGKSSSIKKIYVEDYVMSYMKQLVGEDFSRCRVAVLVGQCIRLDNCRNIFISGAVEVNDLDPSAEIVFSNDIWTGIYENIKKYFVEMEIVGWFIGGSGYLLEDIEKITKAHVDNFAGQDKTLLTYDNMEKEEAFYSYENNRLTKMDGYYIYYEKNEEMQTYMIEHKETPKSNEADYEDKVSKDIRNVLQNKKQEPEENHNVTRLIYMAGTLLAVIVLIIGAVILNNYDQMKNMQDTLNYLSQNLEEVQSIFSDGKSGIPIDTSTVVKGQSSDAAEGKEPDINKDVSDSSEQAEGELEVEKAPGNVNPTEDGSREEEADGKEKLSQSDDNREAGTGEASTQNESEKAQVEEVKYYTVQEGDTLADISYALYHTYTKVKTIMKLNQIEDKDLIYVGQKLIVP